MTHIDQFENNNIGQINQSDDDDDCLSIMEYYILFKDEKIETIAAFEELYALGLVLNVDKSKKEISICTMRLKQLGFTLVYNLYIDNVCFVQLTKLPYIYDVIPFLGNIITPRAFESYSLLKFKCEFHSPK